MSDKLKCKNKSGKIIEVEKPDGVVYQINPGETYETDFNEDIPFYVIDKPHFNKFKVEIPVTDGKFVVKLKDIEKDGVKKQKLIVKFKSEPLADPRDLNVEVADPD